MIKLYCVVLYFPFFPMLSSVLFCVSHLFFVLYYSVVCPSFSLFASFVYLPRSSCSSFFCLYCFLFLFSMCLSSSLLFLTYIFIIVLSVLCTWPCESAAPAEVLRLSHKLMSQEVRACVHANGPGSKTVPHPFQDRSAPVSHLFRTRFKWPDKPKPAEGDAFFELTSRAARPRMFSRMRLFFD